MSESERRDHALYMTVAQLKPSQVQRGLNFLEPVQLHALQEPAPELSTHDAGKADETGRLGRLVVVRKYLAAHGLDGGIKCGGSVNSYCDDLHEATGRFDFVLANPPFNVNAVDKERLKDMVGPTRRFPFGLRCTDGANYLGIQLLPPALKAKGRVGFVLAVRVGTRRSCSTRTARYINGVHGVACGFLSAGLNSTTERILSGQVSRRRTDALMRPKGLSGMLSLQGSITRENLLLPLVASVDAQRAQSALGVCL